MEYRIIKATSETGQIEVVYSNEGIDVATFAIDVPIINGAFLTGDALDNEIRHRAPIWMIQREQEIKTATGFDEILSLLPPISQNEEVSINEENSIMWQKIMFEQQVAKVLVKFGVLQEDPTTINTTQL